MSYQGTIQYLFGLQKHGVKFGLSNTVRLMDLLGGPHRRFRSVHVAGTNGKGSTSAILASVLQAAGYRVGLYTSPHLVDFTERIRINGVPIAEGTVVGLAESIRTGAAGTGELSPTFFEVTTAIAFGYFAEQKIDIAVVETGMGGRLDATNVITPLVSVITNIDLEHTEFLGTTLEQIAAEKAGIIKPGVPVVTGVAQPEAWSVILAEANRQGARCYRMPADFGPEEIAGGAAPVFRYRGIAAEYAGLRITMRGSHQFGNASLALAAAECLGRQGMVLSEPAIRTGLERARWEGRLEQVAERPDIVLDGAHNPASAAVLAEALTDIRKAYRRLILVVGILKDKDHQGILDRLLPLADQVIVTRPRYQRATAVEELAGEVRRAHRDVRAAGTVADAIELARAGAGAEDLIIVTGSLYTVGDARAVLCGARPDPGALDGLKG